MKIILLMIFAIIAARAEQLRITIYDDTRLDRATLGQTAEKLQRIFRRADLEIVLSMGDPEAPENSLILYPDRPPSHRRQQIACRARRDIAMNIVVAPRGLRPGVLGMALPLSGEGLNVRVFVDRALDMASYYNRPFASVLAHVMAHEIGHVLLRTEAHGHHGIMTAVWTAREYEQMTSSATLFFTREQAARMRDTLAGKGCESEAPTIPHSVRAVAMWD